MDQLFQERLFKSLVIPEVVLDGAKAMSKLGASFCSAAISMRVMEKRLKEAHEQVAARAYNIQRAMMIEREQEERIKAIKEKLGIDDEGYLILNKGW